jgi:menaquinone-dependent protoporphyrinogen oxidase
MKPILLIYATREGHTRHIAEHIAAMLKKQNRSFRLIDAALMPRDLSVADHSSAIIAASLHAGKHESEMVRFVTTHLAELRDLPTLFLSISLSQVMVEDPNAPAEKRAQAESDVKRTLQEFFEQTCWKPSHVAAVAGALQYSKYNFLIRYVMKRISGKAGGPVDTTRDYEFTDWNKLDDLVEHFVQSGAHATP